MLGLPSPIRALHLLPLLALVSAASIRPNPIFGRDDSCAKDSIKCSQPGLPDNFCCNTGASCILLAGGTTVLCCPDGPDGCGRINPVICDISMQDPNKNAGAEIKTTVLDVKLETCGSGCCPFGYHCDGDSCVQDEDQSKKPTDGAGSASGSGTATQGSPTSTATDQSSPSSTSTTGAGTVTGDAPATESPDPATKKTANTAAVVGGVVGGVVGLVVLVAGFLLLRHRRKQAKKAATSGRQKRMSSSSSFGNVHGFISNPIPNEKYGSGRTDFVSKAQSSSVATTPTQAQGRFPPASPSYYYGGNNTPAHLGESPYRRDSTALDAVDEARSYHPSAEIGGLRSLTGSGRFSGGLSTLYPPGQQPLSPLGRDHRQGSGGSESINVFADPSVSGGRRDTTWTDIQYHADTAIPETPPVRRR
ncbi:hypothetical protein F4780DRAFT_211225 [Xylariomycetidae sp. FL0641]|nr:hypothetical protein F4780DRAFT_211225 [Xylariomycetidae sp. FL0641]